MAVTSIWAVHRSIKDALDYATNPEKTENPNEEDLRRLMDYAENPDKTEQRYLISGVRGFHISVWRLGKRLTITSEAVRAS